MPNGQNRRQLSDVQEKKEEVKLRWKFMFEWNAEVPVVVDCFCVIRLLVLLIFFLYFSVFAFSHPQWTCVNCIKSLGEDRNHELNLKAIYSFIQIIYCIRTSLKFCYYFSYWFKIPNWRQLNHGENNNMNSIMPFTHFSILLRKKSL